MIYQDTECTVVSVPDQRTLIPEPATDVEKPLQENSRLTEEIKRYCVISMAKERLSLGVSCPGFKLWHVL